MSSSPRTPPDPFDGDGVAVPLPPDSRLSSLDYHREGTTYRGVLERDCESTSMAIVEGVALVLEQDPTTLTPLATLVDPASLDRLTSQDVDLTFEYEDVRVTAYGDRLLEFVY